MKKSIIAISLGSLIALFTLNGCTVHPKGEREERQTALSVGKVYEKPFEKRDIPPWPSNPTPDDLVHYALLTNADVEQKYWQWRAAIEQITIDGTQATNLSLSASTTLHNGGFAADRTNLVAGNDPMADIVLPNKLSAAATRTLETARAAGLRFRKAQFDLRQKVLDAYEDYAGNAEMIRLAEENIQLLQTTNTVNEARNDSGAGGQGDILKARNEVDLARNDIENMQSQLPIQRAALNALLNRSPGSPIPVPASLPRPRRIMESDQDILNLAARANPELQALADEIRAQHEDIHLARLQYYPDFNLSVSTDLAGTAQSLIGGLTVPIFRYEALAAAVAQAQSNLRAAEATRCQAGHDLAAQLVDDIATLRDADRQIDLLQHEILPRARQSVSLVRTSFQTGNASLLDLLNNQKALIDIQRLVINLLILQGKRTVEIESIDSMCLVIKN